MAHAAPVAAEDVRALLDPATWSRLPSVDRRPTASAHALLRLVLSARTGLAPHAVLVDHACPTCGGSDHGRPVLRDLPLHVSLAATRSAVAVAVCAHAPVGVDVEEVAGTRFDGFDDVALAPSETAGDDVARARAWTRKEAVLKARGTGLAVDPRTVDVRSDRVGDCRVLDVAVGAGLAAAVAVRSTRRPRLELERRDLSR